MKDIDGLTNWFNYFGRITFQPRSFFATLRLEPGKVLKVFLVNEAIALFCATAASALFFGVAYPEAFSAALQEHGLQKIVFDVAFLASIFALTVLAARFVAASISTLLMYSSQNDQISFAGTLMFFLVVANLDLILLPVASIGIFAYEAYDSAHGGLESQPVLFLMATLGLSTTLAIFIYYARLILIGLQEMTATKTTDNAKILISFAIGCCLTLIVLYIALIFVVGSLDGGLFPI